MPRHLAATILVAAAVAALVPNEPGSATDQASPSPQDALAPPPASSAVYGVLRRQDGLPVSGVVIRVRDTVDGHTAGTATTANDGGFRVEALRDGSYIVEAVSEGHAVLAVSDVVEASHGRTSAVSLTVPSRSPWLSGYFGNAAAPAITAASKLGITAAGSNGTPVSPQ